LIHILFIFYQINIFFQTIGMIVSYQLIVLTTVVE